MAMAARALEKFYRGEFQRFSSSQTAARGLKDFNRLRLERGRGLGRWAGFGRSRPGLFLRWLTLRIRDGQKRG